MPPHSDANSSDPLSQFPSKETAETRYSCTRADFGQWTKSTLGELQQVFVRQTAMTWDRLKPSGLARLYADPGAEKVFNAGLTTVLVAIPIESGLTRLTLYKLQHRMRGHRQRRHRERRPNRIVDGGCDRRADRGHARFARA